MIWYLINIIQTLIDCQLIYDNLLFSWGLLMSWRRTVRIGVVIFFYRRRLWTLRSALKIFLSILEYCDWDSYLVLYIHINDLWFKGIFSPAMGYYRLVHFERLLFHFRFLLPQSWRLRGIPLKHSVMLFKFSNIFYLTFYCLFITASK